eukprot:61070-Hanusia_phi.AAC.1
MFVSDKYVKSANCRREIQRACQAGKHIVPVFVPVLFQKEKDSKKKESESGWTGRKAKDRTAARASEVLEQRQARRSTGTTLIYSPMPQERKTAALSCQVSSS